MSYVNAFAGLISSSNDDFSNEQMYFLTLRFLVLEPKVQGIPAALGAELAPQKPTGLPLQTKHEGLHD